MLVISTFLEPLCFSSSSSKCQPCISASRNDQKCSSATKNLLYYDKDMQAKNGNSIDLKTDDSKQKICFC